MIVPERIAEIQRAWVGNSANRCAAKPANDGARAGIAGKRAYRRARTRAQQASGYSTVTLGRSARG